MTELSAMCPISQSERQWASGLRLATLTAFRKSRRQDACYPAGFFIA